MNSGAKVLVTGCSGLLGGALCEALLDQGARVYGLDKVYPAKSRIHEMANSIKLITADVRELQSCADVLRSEQIEFIYHLAAQPIVGEAAKEPVETFKDNICGTWNILEAARLVMLENGSVLGLIVASSDKAYGEHDNLPYLEDAPLQGRYPYDVSKTCADLLAQSYFHSFALPVCIIRCGNLFGPGDLQFSRLVPGTILSFLKNERPVIRSDGQAIRDYIYVKDAANAYVALSAAMQTQPSLHGEAFNIADRNPLCVLDVVHRLQELMDCAHLPPVIENTAKLEIRRQFLNSEKIERLVGWHPSFAFEQGLKETIDWYRTVYFQNTNQMAEA